LTSKLVIDLMQKRFVIVYGALIVVSDVVAVGFLQLLISFLHCHNNS